MSAFALKLSKQIEKLAIKEKKDTKECIRAGINLLEKKRAKQE